MILAENFDAILKSRAGILPGERLGRRFFLFPADLSLRSPFANSAKEQTDSNMASESVCFYRAAVRAGLDHLQVGRLIFPPCTQDGAAPAKTQRRGHVNFYSTVTALARCRG